MLTLIIVIIDQIIKHIIVLNKPEIEIIKNVFGITFTQNTRWYVWNVSKQ